MKNLIDFALKEKYYNVKKLRSRLEDMKSIIDWNSFLKLLRTLKNSLLGEFFNFYASTKLPH